MEIALNSLFQNLFSKERTSLLNEDMETFGRTVDLMKAMLKDEAGKEVRDDATKLWLKQMGSLVNEAQNLLDEYKTRVQEARGDSLPRRIKNVLSRDLDGMSFRLKNLKNRYKELVRNLDALQLKESTREVRYAAVGREIRDNEAAELSNNDEEYYPAVEEFSDHEPLQSNTNFFKEPNFDGINDGTKEHFERVESYAINSVRAIAILTTLTFKSTLKKRGHAIFYTTCICLFISLLSNFVVIALFGTFPNFVMKTIGDDIKTLYRNYFPHQHKDHWYIFIYVSTFISMLCGLFPLLAGDANYGFLAIFPTIALIIMTILFRWGCKLGHLQSATKYREHDGKLKYYSDFSSAVTNTAFTGLSFYILASPTGPHQNGVKPTEIFLYVVLAASLLMMQLSSVPPAVSNSNKREHVMEAMRYLSYIMVGLLFLVVLLATGAILLGTISILIYIAGTTVFVVIIVINELNVRLWARNEPAEEVKLDLPAMVVVGFTFDLLMFVYSKYVDDRTKIGNDFILLLVSLLCSCTAFIISLSMAPLAYDGTRPPNTWPPAKTIFSWISYAFAFVLAALSFCFTWLIYSPGESWHYTAKVS